MTQFYYNFSADSLGNVPSYITLRRNAVNADYQIVDISGIKNLRYLSSSASSAKAASYNLAVSSGKTEIYGEIQDLDSSDPASARLILFATDSPDSEYGTHYDSAFGSAGRFVVYRRLNGTYAELSVSSSETEGFRFSKYKVRFQVEPGSPNQIKAKFWLAGNPEPETWKIQTTDAARTISAGWSGHVGFAVSDTVYYQAVAIGTEGDAAPTAPISNETVTSDVQLIINIQQALTAELDINYDLRESLQSDLQCTWNMLNAIHMDVGATWSIIQNLTADLQADWQIVQNVDIDVELPWTIESAIQTAIKDLNTSWHIRHAVVASLNTQWQLLAALEIDLKSRWNIAESIITDMQLLFAQRQQVMQSATLTWHQISIAENSITFTWKLGDTVLPPISIIKIRPETRVFRAVIH